MSHNQEHPRPAADPIQGLTEGAMLSAIGLSLLALQFAFPPLFMIMIGLVPVVFGAGATRLPLRYVLMTGVWVIAAASLLFGVVMGLWAMFYVIHGTAGGLMLRAKFWLPVRVIISTATFTLLSIALIGTLGLLAHISWSDITAALDDVLVELQYDTTHRSPSDYVPGLIALIGAIQSLTMSIYIRRTLRRLDS